MGRASVYFISTRKLTGKSDRNCTVISDSVKRVGLRRQSVPASALEARWSVFPLGTCLPGGPHASTDESGPLTLWTAGNHAAKRSSPILLLLCLSTQNPLSDWHILSLDMLIWSIRLLKSPCTLCFWCGKHFVSKMPFEYVLSHLLCIDFYSWMLRVWGKEAVFTSHTYLELGITNMSWQRWVDPPPWPFRKVGRSPFALD